MLSVRDSGSCDLGKSVVQYVEDGREGKAILAYAESETIVIRSMVSGELKGRASQIYPKEIFERWVAGHDDLSELAPLFGSAEHRKVYANAGPLSRETVEGIVARDVRRAFEGNPWTGCVIIDKGTGKILGRGAIGSGWDPKENTEGSYQSVLGEMQMGDFVVAREGEEREQLYREMVLTLLVMARHFSEAKIPQNGIQVPRYTITVIDPAKHQGVFPEEAEKELHMRIKVLTEIFGQPLGVLPPKSQDVRNYGEHWRFVFGCNVPGVRVSAKAEEDTGS